MGENLALAGTGSARNDPIEERRGRSALILAVFRAAARLRD
jgi:hypothetical protein